MQLPSTCSKSNTLKAVCYLFVVAVLVGGCTLGRANLEIQDVSIKPDASSLGPVKVPMVP
jgi:hypothetical protein